MSDNSKQQKPRQQAQARDQKQRQHNKMPRLPKNATVTKRPLLHPAPPSKYAGPQHQKTLYLSSSTPFMSAVKRVEKFLAQVEKRDTQSAAQIVKNDNKRKRKFGKMSNDEESGEILEVAKKLAEKQGDKSARGEGEGLGRDEVVVKATGKAVQKALSVGVWFLKKDGYGITVKTGSVAAIDDIEIDDQGPECERKEGEDAVMKEGAATDVSEEEIPETRIRYTSTVEISVFRA